MQEAARTRSAPSVARKTDNLCGHRLGFCSLNGTHSSTGVNCISTRGHRPANSYLVWKMTDMGGKRESLPSELRYKVHGTGPTAEAAHGRYIRRVLRYLRERHPPQWLVATESIVRPADAESTVLHSSTVIVAVTLQIREKRLALKSKLITCSRSDAGCSPTTKLTRPRATA